MPYDRRARRSIEQGGAHVSNGDAGSRSLAGLARGGGGHACQHGEHRRLLAPGLCRPGGTLRSDRRQRSAYPQRAWTQDRREGRRVDRRSGAPWADRQELRAAAPVARAARSAALSAQARREPGRRTQSPVEASGNGQHQAGERDERRFRRLRPGHAQGADRRRRLSRGDGGSRQGPAAAQAGRSHPGARGANGGTSSVPPGHPAASNSKRSSTTSQRSTCASSSGSNLTGRRTRS